MARSPRTRNSAQGMWAETDTVAPVPAGRGSSKRIVIFVHGIRDPAFWTQTLKQLFEAQGFKAIPIGYHAFDIVRFLLGIRRDAVEQVKRKIRNIIDDDDNEGAEITVIAHSFGTYIVTQILEEDPSIDITNLIMCGGIVRRNFRWDKLVKLNGQNNRRVFVLNEYSPLDIWPIFARHATLGFGDIGTIGCQDDSVTDRQHHIPHSGYLTEAFVKKYWLSWIADNQPLMFNTNNPSPPWYVSLAQSPVTLLQLATAIFLAACMFKGYDWLTFRTQGVLKFDTADIGLDFSVLGRTQRDRDWEQLFSAVSTSSPLEHRIFSLNRYRALKIEIANRKPISCNPNSLEDEVEERSSQVKTTYELDLSGAHRWFGKSEIELSYAGSYKLPEPATIPEIDKLTINVVDGMDASGITLLSVVHHGNKCLDENFPFNKRLPKATPFVEFAALDAQGKGFAEAIGLSTSAQAADKKPLSSEDLKSLLQSRDAKTRSIAVKSLNDTAAKNAQLLRDLLEGNASLDNTTLAGLLEAASSAGGQAANLDPEKIIQLTYHNDVVVRDAARVYLRSPNINGPRVLEAFDKVIADQLSSLRQIKVEGKQYGRDYLVLVAARDAHYNNGIQLLDRHLSELMDGKSPDFAPVSAAFERGRALKQFAANERERVSLAKNTFGLAMARARSAGLKQAIDAKGTNEAINFIIAAQSAKTPLADTTAQAVFNQFLSEVKTAPEIYPWQNHMVISQKCAQAMTFSCYQAQEKEEK